MPDFVYEARSADGKNIKGRINAATADEAANILLKQQSIPKTIRPVTKADEKKGKSNKIEIHLFGNKVKLEELSIFSENMATLLDAGVPIVTAVKQLAQTTTARKLRAALTDVAEHIQSGQTLSSALRRHKKVFPRMYCNIIEVGENTGQLELSFSQLSSYLINEANIKKRIKSATRYPKIVISALLLAMIVINVFVVPKFAAFFKTMDKQLPTATRILISSSDFFIGHWKLLLFFIVVTIVALKLFVQSKSGRFFWDKQKLRMPIFGKLLKHIMITRFAWAFALMLNSGIPLLAGLNLVEAATENLFFKTKIEKIRLDIQSGRTLTQALSASKLFSPLVLQMIVVGEESGRTANMFEKIAKSYEKDTDYTIQKFSDMLEPTLLIFMGVMVLVLALGIFMPMYSMMNQ